MRVRPDWALDALNFFLADVRGGLGAYVNVYLFAHAGWDQARLGAVMTASGLIGILLHAPIGASIDRTPRKRAMVLVSVVLLVAAALAIALYPTTPVVFLADVTMAILGAVFAPAVAAITVGLTDRKNLAARIGRNAAFDRAGNLFIAALIGVVSTVATPGAPFLLVPVFAVFSVVALFAIPAKAIDHRRARGLEAAETDRPDEPTPWLRLLTYRPLLILAGSVALFYFANGPMLALLGQEFALSHPGEEMGLTSLAIIVSQLATIGVALLVTRADRIGRKPLVVLAFAALPVRGLLCALSSDPLLVLPVQLLDGVGAGLLEALLPLLLADIMRGSGHYSAARGLVGFVQGIGGSLSQLAAGTLVVAAGYSATFLTLAAIALVPLGVALLAWPETARPGRDD